MTKENLSRTPSSYNKPIDEMIEEYQIPEHLQHGYLLLLLDQISLTKDMLERGITYVTFDRQASPEVNTAHRQVLKHIKTTPQGIKFIKENRDGAIPAILPTFTNPDGTRTINPEIEEPIQSPKLEKIRKENVKKLKEAIETRNNRILAQSAAKK